MAERLLMNEYKDLAKEKWLNIELNNDNVFDWTIALIVLNPDSLYYGGYFKSRVTFPSNYPYAPPGSYLALNLLDLPGSLANTPQNSNSSAPSTTPTSTPTAASASRSCTPLAQTTNPASSPQSAGPRSNASNP
jgi:hypothetical protein